MKLLIGRRDHMPFQIIGQGSYPHNPRNMFCLHYDNWDDYSFKTSFYMDYYDSKGKRKEIGPIKIGIKNMEENTRVYDLLSESFDSLPKDYFSLGQSEEYYEHISQFEDNLRCSILKALRDIAFDINLYEEVRSENVVKKSLLRGISDFSLRYQLNRMANGGARLTKYEFKYTSPSPRTENDFSSIQLNFQVVPGSNPPTNIHVLIGRNGTGKTRLLQNMIKSICQDDSVYGCFGYDADEHYSDTTNRFANVLCVAFSPFDDFPSRLEGEFDIPYTYIGLKKKNSDYNLLSTIENQFWASFDSCMKNVQKKKRWVTTMEILKSDPTFSESQFDIFVDETDDPKTTNSDFEKRVKSTFSRLSSGHKVTLLIITCCVDKLEEKSIVFMDEPENHLHPPLLSAFIRALSFLLIDRNGVAIISTHSPVILQEVPRSCVWKLRRNGVICKADRLSVESFGSDISTLTTEIFGLEVTNSGFHKLLQSLVDKYHNYDRIMSELQEQLGAEGRALLRTMISLSEDLTEENDDR